MNWKQYSEIGGRPPTHEVVLRFDPKDSQHPFLRSRKDLYEQEGKKVVLVPIRKDGAR